MVTPPVRGGDAGRRGQNEKREPPGGVSGEVVAAVTERAFDSLRSPSKRVGLPPSPTPASPSLAESYYPRARDLAVSICATLGVSVPEEALTALDSKGPIDVPDSSFTGPF